jgi:tetratricopeptide (TPR) repeat protein
LKRNTAPAIEACDRAHATSPNEPRFLYQKGRALYAANASDPRGRAIFDELMNAGYPSAFDNAAQYLMREGRMREAEGLLRRGVQLQDPDAMVSLADAVKAGSMSARTPGEEFILYQMAAKLGHQGAKNYVEQMQAVGNFVSETGGQLLRAIGR